MNTVFGTPRPVPWLAAVFEGAGATLWWDVASGESGGEVWDAPRAAAWLEADDTLRYFARAAAFAAWREAWWPASRIAGIAPLDPRILAAERAVALAALDGATDDEDAASRALADLARWTAILGAADEADLATPVVLAARAAGVLEQDAAGITAGLEILADDHGIELARATVPARADYALAAAGSAPATALASGSDQVDPGAVPQGVVDPFARIEWRLDLAMTLEVSVAAAPTIGTAPDISLTASIGGASSVGGIEVPLERSDGLWIGTAAGAALLALPPEARVAILRVRGFDPVPGVDPETLARIAERG